MSVNTPGVRPRVKCDSVAIDREPGAGRGIERELVFSCLVNKEDASVSDSKAVSLGSNQLVDTFQ